MTVPPKSMCMILKKGLFETTDPSAPRDGTQIESPGLARGRGGLDGGFGAAFGGVRAAGPRGGRCAEASAAACPPARAYDGFGGGGDDVECGGASS